MTFEGESEKTLAFLDVKITWDDNINTPVCQKPTFTVQGINFFSNIYHKSKSAAIGTLINRAFKYLSSFPLIHAALTTFFLTNGFSLNYFNSILRSFSTYNTVKNHW